MRYALIKVSLLIITLWCAAPLSQPAIAQTKVDLELVVSVDISWSMDPQEQALQREGYVSAFRDRDLWAAIKAGRYGRIAVTYVEWAGENLQTTVIPWTLIDGPVAAEAFADRLERQPISRNRFTSISGALLYSARQFGKGGFIGDRQVIDVSGDGPNNSGVPVVPVRDALVERGIVINGLPIILKGSSPGSYFDIADLDAYYTHCVIGGPGAFVIAVRKREELAAAIRRKLILEIADLLNWGALQPTQNREELADAGYDCMVGERQWQRYNNRFGVP